MPNAIARAHLFVALTITFIFIARFAFAEEALPSRYQRKKEEAQIATPTAAVEKSKVLRKEKNKKTIKANAQISQTRTPSAIDSSKLPDRTPAVDQNTLRLRDLIFGGTDEEIENYKKILPAGDQRLNRVELGAVIAAQTLSAQSENWARQKTVNAFMFGLKGQFWITPVLGFGAGTSFSPNSTMNPSLDNSQTVAQTQQSTFGKLLFRRFDGAIDRPTWWEFSLGFKTEKTSISNTAGTGRIGHLTQGLSLGTTVRIPNPTYGRRWIHSLEVLPLSLHEESNPNAWTSGTKNSTFQVNYQTGLEWDVGNNHMESKRRELFQSFLGISYEQNRFQGQTGSAQPTTGVTTNNVKIETWTVQMTCIYQWGW